MAGNCNGTSTLPLTPKSVVTVARVVRPPETFFGRLALAGGITGLSAVGYFSLGWLLVAWLRPADAGAALNRGLTAGSRWLVFFS